MAVVLRPYQDKAVEEVREGFRAGNDAVLFQLATGGGKTITSGSILGSAAGKGNRGMFICNRVELLNQTASAFDNLGIRYGLIAPGYRYSPAPLVHIASIDTLKGRIKKGEIVAPKLAVWDECRSCGAAGWAAVFKWMKEQGAKQLGLDATPIRQDGRPLGEFFQHLVHGPTYTELMDLGALVPFECYAPSTPDLSSLRTKGHDYDQADAEEAMDKPSITGDIIANYVQRTPGQKALVFAVSRKHSEHLAAEFRAAGVKAIHLDGDTDAGDRARAVAAYRRGDIEVICNVDLYTAGFDVPEILVIIDASPSKSLAKVLQRAGRASRPAPGKTFAIYFDHAGNLLNHGLPDDDREWSLEGRKKKQKKDGESETVNLRQCPDCFRAHTPRPTCPGCGHVYEVESREVAQVEGELRKLTKEEMALRKAVQAKELKKARTLPELERIAEQRGYSKGWAKNVFDAKQKARERYSGGDDRFEQQFESYVGWRR